MKWHDFETEFEDFEFDKKSKGKSRKIKKMKDFDKIIDSKKKNKPRE